MIGKFKVVTPDGYGTVNDLTFGLESLDNGIKLGIANRLFRGDSLIVYSGRDTDEVEHVARLTAVYNGQQERYGYLHRAIVNGYHGALLVTVTLGADGQLRAEVSTHT